MGSKKVAIPWGVTWLVILCPTATARTKGTWPGTLRWAAQGHWWCFSLLSCFTSDAYWLDVNDEERKIKSHMIWQWIVISHCIQPSHPICHSLFINPTRPSDPVDSSPTWLKRWSKDIWDRKSIWVWGKMFQIPVYPPWNQHSPWKLMVGILLYFWETLFSGALIVSGR